MRGLQAFGWVQVEEERWCKARLEKNGCNPLIHNVHYRLHVGKGATRLKKSPTRRLSHQLVADSRSDDPNTCPNTCNALGGFEGRVLPPLPATLGRVMRQVVEVDTGRLDHGGHGTQGRVPPGGQRPVQALA